MCSSKILEWWLNYLDQNCCRHNSMVLANHLQYWKKKQWQKAECQCPQTKTLPNSLSHIKNFFAISSSHSCGWCERGAQFRESSRENEDTSSGSWKWKKESKRTLAHFHPVLVQCQNTDYQLLYVLGEWLLCCQHCQMPLNQGPVPSKLHKIQGKRPAKETAKRTQAL